jgi:predicted RNA-binding Zn ribbon-like protein
MTKHDDQPTPRSRGRDPAFSSLLGDWLCLDFANSVDDRTGDDRLDKLTDYVALARWGWHAWVLTDAERDQLLTAGEARPDDASSVFAQAIDLREAIYCAFAAIAEGGDPAPADLATIQHAHLAALSHAHLARADASFEWVWDEDPALDRLLWPIAISAVALLTSDRLHRVKQCPGCGDCGWLFLDVSKNATRRWCSMDDCGSRAKMRRQYARRKGAA